MVKRNNDEIKTYSSNGHEVHYSFDWNEKTEDYYIQFYKRSKVKFTKIGFAIPESFYTFLWEEIFDLGKQSYKGSDRWYEVTDALQDQEGDIFKAAWLMWRLKGHEKS